MTRAVVAVLVAGTLVAATVSRALGLPGTDTVQLVLLAGGGAVTAGVAGTVLLGWLRPRGLALQVAVVGLVAVSGTGAGAALAGTAMFVSPHDLRALVVVLVASGTVAVACALLLGRRVGHDARALETLARRVGDGDMAVPAGPAIKELASVGRILEETTVRLADAQRRERALERSRRELVAWVSHDLRTPLAGIRAMVEALEDGVVADSETVARYHRTMRQEADRLAALVDDLFELSLIESCALDLTMERVTLGDVLSDALAGARVAAEAKGVRLSGRLSEPAPLLDVSTPEIARVVRNLLDNAIRHTAAPGEVTLEAGVDGAHAFVAVRDSCGGIAADDLGRVFDLAFRGDPARTPGDGGAGLGLAIARGLVEAHAGEIAVQNEDGGCRFTVRLPLSPA